MHDESAGSFAGAALRAGPNGAEPAARSDRTAAPSGATAIVGRRDVIERILTACDAAAAGHGGFVVVFGGVGIGKTTVLNAVARRAERRGFAVSFSHCLAIGAPPLWPWKQLVAGCTGATLPISVDEGTAPRVALFEALTGLFARISKQGPQLLVIEDLHWADNASVQLLVQIAAVLKKKRILVLATLRSDEPVDPQLDLAHSELRRLAGTVISLSGLRRHEIGELIRNWPIEPDELLIDTLFSRTAGNPFFVTEILRSLSDQTLDGAGRACAAALEVPTQVSALVRGRLSRLTEPVSELVRAAAILGSEGDVRVLAAAANLDVHVALDHLRWVVQTGLMVQPTPKRWAFLQVLVRDAIEATLPALTQARLHDAAVRAYESVYGERASIAAVAHHALSSLPLGSIERAVTLGARAGDDASRRLAFASAARSYERTLDALASDDSQHRAELLIGLGNARRAAGNRAAAQAAFQSAAGLSGQRSDVLMAAALGHANPAADLGVAYRAEEPETARLLERALAALTAEDHTGRALLCARLAAELYFSDRAERSRPLSESAIVLARRSGDARSLVTALAVHHDAFVVGAADSPTLLAGSEAIARHARACGDEHARLIAHRARIFDLLVAGDIAGVDTEIAAFARLAERLRISSYLWWPAQWRAMRALLQGEHEKAEQLALDAFAVGSQPFPIFAALNLSYLQFFLKREQGRLTELESTMRAFALDYADVPSVGAGLAFLLAELGQLDEARGLLLRLGVDGFVRLKDRNWPACSFMLARVAALVGDREHAALLFECSQSQSGQCVQVSYGTVCLGSADLALAWLAETVEKNDEAEHYYELAESMNARIGARSWLAQARFDHAELLKRRARPGDLDKSRRLAKQADTARRDSGLCLVVNRTGGDRSDPASATPESRSFRRLGAVWRLSYQRHEATVPHTKGLIDIAWLLAHPGQPIRAVELVAAQAEGLSPSGDGGEVLDKRARREVRERLQDLEQELAEAEHANDLAVIERLRREREALVCASASALGLGGRARRLDDGTERARKAVAARIRNSIHMIAWVHPVLAAHLERSIDTGHLCVYQPERPVEWRF